MWINYANLQLAICVIVILLQFASGLYDCNLRQVYMIENCFRFVLLQFASGLYIAICVRFVWLQIASGKCIIAICVRFVLSQFASGLYDCNLRQVCIITNCVRFVWFQIASGLYDCNLRRCSRVQFKLTMFDFYWTGWNIYIFIYLLNMILAPCLAILNTRFIYRVSFKTWCMGCV